MHFILLWLPLAAAIVLDQGTGKHSGGLPKPGLLEALVRGNTRWRNPVRSAASLIDKKNATEEKGRNVSVVPNIVVIDGDAADETEIEEEEEEEKEVEEAEQDLEWWIFGISSLIFLTIHMNTVVRPSTSQMSTTMLPIWILLALFYCAQFWVRLGSERGAEWTSGYILEFLFSIENVFVFQVICLTFDCPRALAHKALAILVLCQILYEMIFFLSVGTVVQHFQCLPYILGFWLLYVAYSAVKHGAPHGPEDKKCDGDAPWIERGVAKMLGSRYDCDFGDGNLINKIDGKYRITRLALVLACLIAADFALEVDVILTKIENISNTHIAFSSSAIASFVFPEIYLIASQLITAFPALTYGIALVVAWNGVEMLCVRIFTISTLFSICIDVGIMISVLLTSVVLKLFNKDKKPILNPAFDTFSVKIPEPMA